MYTHIDKDKDKIKNMDVQYQYLCRILVDGSDKVNIKEEQTASKIFDINSHNFLIDLEL